MKNQLFALIGLGLLLATASAYAQTGVVKANVPFNFIVDKTQIPAGEYLIQSIGTSNSALVIENKDRSVARMVLPIACESFGAQMKTKLVFHRYGDQYFLAQVWTAGNNRGTQLRQSAREAEVAMDHPVQNVVLAAALR
jgi:hypothetical protein